MLEQGRRTTDGTEEQLHRRADRQGAGETRVLDGGGWNSYLEGTQFSWSMLLQEFREWVVRPISQQTLGRLID